MGVKISNADYAGLCTSWEKVSVRMFPQFPTQNSEIFVKMVLLLHIFCCPDNFRYAEAGTLQRMVRIDRQFLETNAVILAI